MKPPFAYFGGKTAIAEQIVRLLPPHEHYVEPFAGSLAVLLAKRPARMETVNDLDGDLVTFWRMLRDRPTDLARVCALTPHSRAEYLAAYQSAADEIEHARRVWVRLSQGRTGTLAPTGWRNTVSPAGRVGSVPADLAAYVARMEGAARRLASVSLENRPALELIAAYGASADVLLYIDPPYLGTTRNGANYQHEMLHEADHEDLAAALRSCRATVILSGYYSPLYARLYAGWHTARIANGSGQGGVWRDHTEILWSNRPFPVAQADLFSQEAS